MIGSHTAVTFSVRSQAAFAPDEQSSNAAVAATNPVFRMMSPSFRLGQGQLLLARPMNQ
jgi:hypothetical protein